MGIVFMDGFDHYSIEDAYFKWSDGPFQGDAWYGITTYKSPHSARRANTQYYWAQIGAMRHAYAPPGEYKKVILGSAIINPHGGYTRLLYSASISGGIELGATGDGEVTIGQRNTSNGYTELCRSDYGAFELNKWHFFELKLFYGILGDSSGYGDSSSIYNYDSWVECRVDEIVVCSAYFDMTAGVDGIGAVQIGTGGFANNFIAWDDLYVINMEDGVAPTDYIGDCRIDTLYPDANGYQNDFTPKSGNNYENVNEEYDIDRDDTYCESADLNDLELYDFEALPALGTPIHAVASNSCVRKTDADRRYFKQASRSASNLYYTDEYELGDTFHVWQNIHNLDPGTSSAWSESGVSAYQSGVKITT